MHKIEDIYMRFWCIVMPVMGTVLIPSVQGTIPAYMMAFGSVIFVLFRLRGGEIPPAVVSYGKALGSVALLWLFLLAASQLSLILSDRHDFSGANLTDSNDSRIAFRGTIFTQSLYFTACILIALYFRYFFRESWMRYVFWGGYLLAGYGIYEWTYYLIFHHAGDFLLNRFYGEIQHPASWSQGVNFGGVSLLRIKSTLGEPTFFTAACLPFLFVALDHKKVVLSAMLIFCALFSTSTACYITFSTCLLLQGFWAGKIKPIYLLLLFVVVGFLAGMAVYFPDNFQGTFGDKLSGDNFSGKIRMESSATYHALINSFTIPNWLFGIGFGNVYLSIYDGLLVNTGLIGLGVFLYFLLKPAIFLPTKPGFEGLKMAMIILAILSYLSLSELFIPTTWMFLALAYRKLAEVKAVRRNSESRERSPGSVGANSVSDFSPLRRRIS
jgi:hypothetical protein